MNTPIATTTVATMTSREIAELTGKDHKNVIRDIRNMLDELEKDGSNLSHVQKDMDARSYTTCFHLNRELTDTLLTGYSVIARNKVIKRWHELENKEAQHQPTINLRDPKQLAAAALQLIEVNAELQYKVEEQQRQIEEAAPKVEALNRLVLADGSLCIRDAAKTLGVQEARLKKVLQECSWAYRHPNGTALLAYSDCIKSGFMEHKVTTGQKCDGGEWVNTQARVTAKGLTKLASLLQQQGMH